MKSVRAVLKNDDQGRIVTDSEFIDPGERHGWSEVEESAIQVFGSFGAANEWLNLENESLGGIKPIELAGDGPGRQIVLLVLNAIREGGPV